MWEGGSIRPVIENVVVFIDIVIEIGIEIGILIVIEIVIGIEIVIEIVIGERIRPEVERVHSGGSTPSSSTTCRQYLRYSTIFKVFNNV